MWFALIGPPSTGKTPALRPVVEISSAIEREAEPAWEAAAAEHALLVESARAMEQKWREAVRKAINEGEPPPDRPPGADAQPGPSRPRVLGMDATTEELQHMLSEQPRGLLYLRDELAGWLGNHDRYGGHGGDRAFFLECWDGGTYVADRVKYRGHPMRIPRASLAIVGSMQPDRLRDALSGADDGLAARLCYVWPEPPPILPLTREADGQARNRRDRLTLVARRLHALPMNGDASGERAPCILWLAGDALRLFDELRCEAMERARSARGISAGWHGKTPGRALRLALVYEHLTWSGGESCEPRAVSADAMARAGGYLGYLTAMLDRVTSGLSIGRAEADAAVIFRHILARRQARLNERELYQQPGWSWLRDRARRVDALRVLVGGAVVREPAHSGKGRPPGDWDVSPRLWEGSP